MVLTGKQLFLSSRVVTENVIITNGGVLVDENGVIEKIVTKKQADDIKKANDGKIKVRKTLSEFVPAGLRYLFFTSWQQMYIFFFLLLLLKVF